MYFLQMYHLILGFRVPCITFVLCSRLFPLSGKLIIVLCHYTYTAHLIIERPFTYVFIIL